MIEKVNVEERQEKKGHRWSAVAIENKQRERRNEKIEMKY